MKILKNGAEFNLSMFFFRDEFRHEFISPKNFIGHYTDNNKKNVIAIFIICQFLGCNGSKIWNFVCTPHIISGWVQLFLVIIGEPEVAFVFIFFFSCICAFRSNKTTITQNPINNIKKIQNNYLSLNYRGRGDSGRGGQIFAIKTPLKEKHIKNTIFTMIIMVRSIKSSV